MDAQTRGTVLALAGVALLLSTLAVGAAMAPDRGVSTDGERRTLVGIQGGGPGWHKYGAVTMVENGSVTWREDSAGSYFDVTMLDNGSVMAGFMDGGRRNCGPYEPPCSRTGFRVIDPAADGGPAVVSEYSFPVRSAKNSEVHDVERLGPDRYLLTDMDAERIFIVDGGEVVWSWNASSFYEAPADVTRTDWLHINDVDVIEAGTFLVSVRNANQLVVVKRGQGVVEVVNADTDEQDGSCERSGQLADQDGDGDVRCGDPSVLNHQHNPQWLGGVPGGDGEAAVLVADSDNDRVVELHRTAGGEWEVAWTLESAGGIHLRWPRDADRLSNGNTLVTDTLNKRIIEVTENGTVVWSTATGRIPYEADRLPEGEPPSGVWYASDTPGPVGAGQLPVLGPAAILLRGVFPWLPFWYTGPHLGLTLVSVVLMGAGAGIAWRGRSGT